MLLRCPVNVNLFYLAHHIMLLRCPVNVNLFYPAHHVTVQSTTPLVTCSEGQSVIEEGPHYATTVSSEC